MTQALEEAKKIVAFSPIMSNAALHVLSFSLSLSLSHINIYLISQIWPNIKDKLLCILPSVTLSATPTTPTTPTTTPQRYPSGFPSYLFDDNHVFLLPCGLRDVKDPLMLLRAFSHWRRSFQSDSYTQRSRTSIKIPYLVIVGPTLDPILGAKVLAWVLFSLSLSLSHSLTHSHFLLSF